MKNFLIRIKIFFTFKNFLIRGQKLSNWGQNCLIMTKNFLIRVKNFLIGTQNFLIRKTFRLAKLFFGKRYPQKLSDSPPKLSD